VDPEKLRQLMKEGGFEGVQAHLESSGALGDFEGFLQYIEKNPGSDKALEDIVNQYVAWNPIAAEEFLAREKLLARMSKRSNLRQSWFARMVSKFRQIFARG